MQTLDRAVRGTLADDVLQPTVVYAVVASVLEALQPKVLAKHAQAYRTELQAAERELARLADAIAAGGALDALVAAVRGRHWRNCCGPLRPPGAADYTRVDMKLIEQHIRTKLRDWRALRSAGCTGRATVDARGARGTWAVGAGWRQPVSFRGHGESRPSVGRIRVLYVLPER